MTKSDNEKWSVRTAWDSSSMDPWRERRGGNRIRSFQPNLVYALEWHHHRSLLSNRRSTATPGPSIFDQRWQEFLP